MSHATDMVTAIEAVIAGRISSDVEQYTIGGRDITKIPFGELIQYRDKYLAEAKAEDDATRLENGDKSKRKVKVTFVNP